MVNATDKINAAAAMATLRAERPSVVKIDRGGVELIAHECRLVRTRLAIEVERGLASEVRAMYIVLCPPDMDIKSADTFAVDGQLYRVVFVRPISEFGQIVAEVLAVQ